MPLPKTTYRVIIEANKSNVTHCCNLHSEYGKNRNYFFCENSGVVLLIHIATYRALVGWSKTPHFLQGKNWKQGYFCPIIWIPRQNINLD